MTSDATLVVLDNEVRAALADDAAFRRWYERTWPRVYGYIQGRTAGDATLAEEIAQQTYVAAIVGRARFDGRSDSVVEQILYVNRSRAYGDHVREIDCLACLAAGPLE